MVHGVQGARSKEARTNTSKCAGCLLFGLELIGLERRASNLNSARSDPEFGDEKRSGQRPARSHRSDAGINGYCTRAFDQLAEQQAAFQWVKPAAAPVMKCGEGSSRRSGSWTVIVCNVRLPAMLPTLTFGCKCWMSVPLGSSAAVAAGHGANNLPVSFINLDAGSMKARARGHRREPELEGIGEEPGGGGYCKRRTVLE